MMRQLSFETPRPAVAPESLQLRLEWHAASIEYGRHFATPGVHEAVASACAAAWARWRKHLLALSPEAQMAALGAWAQTACGANPSRCVCR